jgi:hypothetical protein
VRDSYTGVISEVIPNAVAIDSTMDTATTRQPAITVFTKLRTDTPTPSLSLEAPESTGLVALHISRYSPDPDGPKSDPSIL